MRRRRLFLAAGLCCCMAMFLQAAYFGPAQQQHNTVVLIHFLLRVGAVWPALYGIQGKSARSAFAGSAWTFVAIYCTCAIWRAWWYPPAAAALDLWLPPVCLPYFRRYPFRLFFAYNVADQVLMRKSFPFAVLVLMNTYYALVNSHVVWTRLPGTATSFWQVLASAVIWTVMAPTVLMQLFDKCCSAVHHHSGQPPSVQTADNPTNQAAEAKQSSRKQEQAAATTGAETSHSMLQPQSTQQDTHDPFTYQPAFPRTKVYAKVHTPHGPLDLPHDLAMTLQQGLDGSMQLLSLAVRSGCVCIRLDVGVLDAAGMAAEGGVAQWEYLAGVLLPLLQPMLEDELAATPTKQVVQVHVGSTVLYACWDAASASWQLHTESADISPATAPRMTLGLAQQLLPSYTAAYSFTAHQQAGLGSAPCQATEGPQLHMVHVLAQLVAAEGSALSTTQLADIQGWAPPSGRGRHESVESDSLRILACCGGAYVSTVVLELSQLKAGRTVVDVKLELRVPDSLLPRHHVGGQPVGLLPVTLELWQGALSCVSSSPLLLCISSRVSGGASYVTGGAGCTGGCWWWGASSRTVQQAMTDLQQAIRQQWQRVQNCWRLRSKERQYIKSAQSFLDDLSLWLNEVKCIAVSSGHCTTPPPACGPACTWLQQPSLKPGQMVVLAQHLTEYCNRLQLHGLTRMLQQQCRVVHAWQLRLEALPSKGGVEGSVAGVFQIPADSSTGAAAGVMHANLEQAVSVQGVHSSAVSIVGSDVLQSARRTKDSSAPQTFDSNASIASGLQAPGIRTRTAHHKSGAITADGMLAHSKSRTDSIRQGSQWRRLGSLLVAAIRGASCPQCEMRCRADMIRLLASVQGLASCTFVAGGMLSAFTHPRDAVLVRGTLFLWSILHAFIAVPQLRRMARVKPNSHNTNSMNGHSSHSCSANNNNGSSGQGQTPISQHERESSSHITWLCVVAHIWRVAGQYLLAVTSPKDDLKRQLKLGVFLGNCVMMSVGEQAHALLKYPPVLALMASYVDVGSIYALLYQTDMLTILMVPAAFVVVVLPRLFLEVHLRATLLGSTGHTKL